MVKKTVALVQVNNSYGGQQHLPLSVGCLWAYAQSRTGILSEYDQPTFLYKKEAISKALARLDPLPDLVCLSSYIWNFEWNRALARAVKEVSPTTVVAYGGVHVPDKPTDEWFDQHPECDFLHHGEGELLFSLFLEEFAGNRDWAKVPGLSCRGLHTDRKFPDVDELRSPYLDGVFDKIFPQEASWVALQETDRGCPYRCTFCEWGASAMNKIRPFPMERVLNEIDWFGSHHISYLEGCNANTGILPRDVQIAEALAKTKEKYGYPEKFRAAFAKYSNKRIAEQVFTIAKILHKSGQLKAVTLALQSTNEEVLEAIDRKNISLSGFKELQERYRQEGIPTYIELILGLPGETYETFKMGLDRVLDAGGHDAIAIYMCVLLPNSEMSNPSYIDKYGLESVPMRAMLLHGTPNPETPDEIQPTVIATKDMPHPHWRKGYFLSWIIQTLHCTGLTQWWAVKEREGGLAYSKFYEDLLVFAYKRPWSVLGKVYLHMERLLDQAIDGGSWDNVLPKFSEVSWPPDEGAFLLITKELDQFYEEMQDWYFMPPEQRDHGPPTMPKGREEGYAKTLWFNRKSNLLKALREFCGMGGSQ